MGKLWVVFKREYLERVRTKWFIIGTIFGPIFFGALFTLPTILASRATASPQVSEIIVLDATGSGLGREVETRLSDAGSGRSQTELREITVPQLPAAEEAAMTEVMRGERRGYLVLDAESLAGIRARYSGRNASNVSDIERLRDVVRRSVLAHRLENFGIAADQVESLTRMRLQLATERITERGRGGSGIASIIFSFAVAFLLFFAIFLYGQNVMRGVLEEKQTRVAEVVVSSVSPEKLLAGKVLGVGSVGLTQLLIWVVSMVVLYNVRQPILARFGVPAAPISLPDVTLGAGLLLLAFFIAGYTFYASLFAAAGAMVNSDQEAQQAAQPVMLLAFAGMIFINPVMMNPTGRMAQVVSILPFSAPVIMPLRMSLTAVPAAEIAASLVSVTLAAALVVWLAARIYRVGLLMYGKRPTLRELGRWVRYAG